MTRARLEELGTVLVLVLGFFWFLRPIWSIDIFFHVAIGREILTHGIPTTDLFSAAHPEASWAPFQVGYEVLMAWIEGWGGLDGLRILHAGVFAGALALFYRFLNKHTEQRWTRLLLLVLFLVLFDERIRLRPHLFNLIFEVGILLPLATGVWRKAQKRWLYLCLPIALLWASLHAMGVLWLVAILGAWCVTGQDKGERLWALAAIGLTCIAIVIAPGGLDGIIHVFAIKDVWLDFVAELAPSWTMFSFGSVYGFVCGVAPFLAILAVLIAIATQPSRERWGTLLIAAGLAFASLWMVRLVYYAAFVFVLVLPELRTMSGRLTDGLGKWPAILGTAALTALLFAHVAPRFMEPEINPWSTSMYPGRFPVMEAEALKSAGIQGQIFNDPAWGGYLLYSLHPPSTVLTDGRITFSKDVGELVREASKPGRRVWAATEAHKKYGVDLLVWRVSRHVKKGSGPRQLCTLHEEKTFCWERILRGPLAEVWSPQGPLAKKRRAALARVVGRRR